MECDETKDSKFDERSLKIQKERYISLEKRQQIINELKLTWIKYII